MNIKNIPNQTNINAAQNDAAKRAEVQKMQNAATQPAKTATEQSKTVATQSGDKVTLTATTQQAKGLEKKAEDAKVDNSEKIKALKLAIEKGEYKVDADAVAKKLIQTELAFQKAGA